MKNIINRIQHKHLVFSMIIFGAIAIDGCAAKSQKTSTSNQTANSAATNKTTYLPKDSPTVETAEKREPFDPLYEEDYPNRQAENRSTNNKSDGPLAAKINKASFDKINVGMTYDNVTKIFSDKGMKTSEMKVNGRETVMYMWSNDDYSKYINVEFEKDKVVDKRLKGF